MDTIVFQLLQEDLQTSYCAVFIWMDKFNEQPHSYQLNSLPKSLPIWMKLTGFISKCVHNLSYEPSVDFFLLTLL